MDMKEWMNIDIDNLELLEVTDLEKKHVKQHILKKRNKVPFWRYAAVAAVVFVGVTTATGFAFPSIASQIPFMDNVISYFTEEEQSHKSFEAFSTNIGLAQTSNGMTVMIDNAVYDGTNITVSFAIETDYDFGQEMQMRAPNWFDVVGASGSGGRNNITKISDTRYVGLSIFTPRFKDDIYPELLEVTWTPQAFYNRANELEIEGDWSFEFALERLDGDLQLINETVQNKDINFTLRSVEFTDVSTIIACEQVVSDELLKELVSVSPTFIITDDLGNTYNLGRGGSGMTPDDYKSFKGTSTVDAIEEGASQLIIQPIEIAGPPNGEVKTEIKLEPIVIDLKK